MNEVDDLDDSICLLGLLGVLYPLTRDNQDGYIHPGFQKKILSRNDVLPTKLSDGANMCIFMFLANLSNIA